MSIVARRARDILIAATLMGTLLLIYGGVINHFISDGVNGVFMFAGICGTLAAFGHIAVKAGRNILSIISSGLGLLLIFLYVGLTVGMMIEASQIRVFDNEPPPTPRVPQQYPAGNRTK